MKDNLHRLGMAAWLAFIVFCFWMGLPGVARDVGLEQARSPVSAVRSTTSEQSPSTTPIEKIRVGMRVVGRNPDSRGAQRDLAEPEAATWRLVRVRLQDESEKIVDAELLRPLSWIETHQAQPGAQVWLEFPEMHAAGMANILGVDDCPQLESGSHPLVTGTFRHVVDELVVISVAGQESPIACTPKHPFWSEKQDDFVAAASLQVGEEVLTAYGNSARITSIVPRAGPQTVYGLEVFGEHVYHVGELGLLAHNASGKAPKGGRYSGLTDEQFAQEIARRAERKIGGTGAGKGSSKHAYADKLMSRYQDMTGERTHLEVEQSYLSGSRVPRGTKDSARPDLYDPASGNVYDYKFTIRPGRGIPLRQQRHNARNLPHVGSQIEINP